MDELYPLLTRPQLAQPIWGGSGLAQWLDLPQPRPARLGEVWLVFDANPVTNGPLAGRTIAELARQHGPALVGTRSAARYGADFPLLAKFIAAADRLSIQVHPDDAYAHSREAATGFHGKTEAWHILDAAPGANVTYGLARPSSRDEVAAAVAAETLEQLTSRLPVRPGDTVFVPAGTLHAINAGITLFEIQQKSDLTYRIYDYGRRDAQTGAPRELHLDKALDVLDYAPPSRGAVEPLSLGAGRDLLVACPLFALERWQAAGPRLVAADPGSFAIVVPLGGLLELRWAAGALTLRRGDAAIVPAALDGYELRPLTGTTSLLHVHVPDLAAEYVAPLLAQGVARERIAQSVIE